MKNEMAMFAEINDRQEQLERTISGLRKDLLSRDKAIEQSLKVIAKFDEDFRIELVNTVANIIAPHLDLMGRRVKDLKAESETLKENVSERNRDVEIKFAAQLKRIEAKGDSIIEEFGKKGNEVANQCFKGVQKFNTDIKAAADVASAISNRLESVYKYQNNIDEAIQKSYDFMGVFLQESIEISKDNKKTQTTAHNTLHSVKTEMAEFFSNSKLKYSLTLLIGAILGLLIMFGAGFYNSYSISDSTQESIKEIKAAGQSEKENLSQFFQEWQQQNNGKKLEHEIKLRNYEFLYKSLQPEKQQEFEKINIENREGILKDMYIESRKSLTMANSAPK